MRTTALGALVVLAMTAAPVTAEVFARFYNGIDVSGYSQCSWQPGRPAQDHRVEEEIRARVGNELRRLGYEVSESGGDCWIRSHAVRDQAFPVGMLLIEIYDVDSELIAFRGEATGLVNRTPKEILKDVRKSIKKMFKYFPRAEPPSVE